MRLRRALAAIALSLLSHLSPSQALAANYYVSSVAYAAVPQWTANHAYTVGSFVRQLAAPAVNAERVFKATACTTCTSAGSEPAWVLTAGATTTDGGVTWTEVTGTEANQSAGNWTAPAARMADLGTSGRNTAYASGDQIFVSSDHLGTAAAAVTLPGTNVNVSVFSVSRTGATLPPTTADLAAGATEQATGANNISLGGSGIYYFNGLTFEAGNAGATSSSIVSNGGSVTCDNCTFWINNTATNSNITLNATSAVLSWVWNNVGVEFGNTNQGFGSITGAWTWNGSPSPAINNGGSIPAHLISANGGASSQQGVMWINNVDLSNLNTAIQVGNTQSNRLIITNSKLNSAVVEYTSGAALSTNDDLFATTVDNSDATTNYRMFHAYRFADVNSDSSVVRTGGASDGVTPISHRILAVSTPTPAYPGRGVSMLQRNTATGVSKTVTVYLIYNGAAVLDNAHLWLEVNALTNAGSPLGSITSSRVANLLAGTAATNLTTDTSAWDSQATARGNLTVYPTGSVIKVPDNPGRIFISTSGSCTNAGSEPAGYASAVDGGSVTDGSCSFRAGMRMKISVSVTPQVAGLIKSTLKYVDTAGNFLWYDPLPVIQ